MQLANYLLSRRHVSKVRSASQMLAALTTLSSNKFFVPVAISLDKPGSTVGAKNKKVRFMQLDCSGGGGIACRNILQT